MRKEKEVLEELAKLQAELDETDSLISETSQLQGAHGSTNNEQETVQENKLRGLERAKAQKQLHHQRLSESTEKAQKQEYHYKKIDPFTGAQVDCAIDQILESRLEVPQLRIPSLESRDDYVKWAEAVRSYLYVRGVMHVLNETEEENVPGMYGGRKATLRDRDDALARFIISTALTETQCVHVRYKETAEQYWAAFKQSYGPRDGSGERYITEAEVHARLMARPTEAETMGRRPRPRRGRGRGRGRS